MTAARVRISKVRMKGGAEVTILPREQRADGENYKGLVIEHARMVAEDPAEMVGFVVIAIYADGTYRHGVRLDKDAAIGRTMLPAYVADIVRRGVITEPLVYGEI